jgi:hypothetical protein
MNALATGAARYRIFDLVLESDLPLAELGECPDGKPAIRFAIAPELAPEENSLAWIHEWTLPDGRVSIASARHAGGYLLRFPGLADFLVSGDGSRIACLDAECPASTIRHLLLDQVVPRVVGHGGRLVAHAGCVELEDGRAIAFLGSTGWGKSTLAAAFVADGARLVTDDCLLIESHAHGVRCIPSYTGLRLLPDAETAPPGAQFEERELAHYSAKRRYAPAAGPGNEFRPLSTLFVLGDPSNRAVADQITIERLTGAAAFMSLLSSAFTLDVGGRRAIERHFETTGTIGAAAVPCFRLEYPREYGRLGEVLDAMRRCGPGTPVRSENSDP